MSLDLERRVVILDLDFCFNRHHTPLISQRKREREKEREREREGVRVRVIYSELPK